MLLLLQSLLAFTKDKQSEPNKGLAIGIDLGTTYSCLFVHDPNTNSTFNIKIDNHETFPSVLAFESFETDGKREYLPLTGYEAIRHNKKNPNSDNMFYAWKRLMGLSAKDMETKELKDIHKKVTYKIAVDKKEQGSVVSMLHKENGKVVQKVRPIDASKFVLQALYQAAKKYSSEIATVVVTVPAYFTENQVKATSNAVDFSGITLTRTMNEPVAAAYAYQMKEGRRKDDKYFVFDFGGGTLDISALEYEDEVLEVRTYSGDNFLGGENVNDCLFNYFSNKIIKEYNNDFNDMTDRLRLRAFVETFKIALCEKQNAEPKANVSHTAEFYVTEDDMIEFTLSTKQFNDICMPVFNRVKKYIKGGEEALITKYEKLGGSINSISKVLFVGGSSRIPYIRKMLGEIFGEKKLYYGLNADTVVAEGAAWYSAALAGYLDEKTSLHLVDVVSANIGICVGEDEFHPILEMDTTIPAKGTKIFTTAYDMQDRVSIQVAQGLRFSFKDNNHLGTFDLIIKNPGPRGVPQIEVTVSMDKDRNVHVKAMDKATNLEEEIIFKSDDCSLTPDEITQMKKDREANLEKDNELRERYEEKRKLENYIDSCKARMEGISDENKTRVDKIILGAQAWLKSEKDAADKYAFTEKYESLKEEIEPLLKKEPGFEKGFEKGEDEKIREEL
ncbi:ATPase with role in protein import into the ER [Conglomerata obtusa]